MNGYIQTLNFMSGFWGEYHSGLISKQTHTKNLSSLSISPWPNIFYSDTNQKKQSEHQQSPKKRVAYDQFQKTVSTELV